MSTLTRPKTDAVTTPPVTLRGPARVLLRLHRKALWAAGVLLVLGIGIVVALRVWMASAKELCADGDITPCGGPVYQPSYARTSTELFLSDGGTVLLLLAGLIGVFVAGPLIARELESGTFRLAWAQSVSPAHWLAARLAVPAALAVIGLTVLIAVYRWGLWALRGYPYSHLTPWYASGVFPGTGPALLGFALLAVAVGALCAVLVRRTLLSMSLTALVLGVVALGLGKRRYELWPAVLRQSAGPVQLGPGDWDIDMGWLTESGRKLYWQDCDVAYSLRDIETCMRERGAVDYFAEVHPASHYWPLQLVETGILLALAALAVFAAFRVLRRLHG
ncbi:ABC transporter permease [Streptomyces sp. ATCC51928]|uniref:ABC transporter permease n=1 Tax=Streptomyces caviscabies TaxID=90079 RepID=A0ABW2MN90_9ACTN|nr:MULTISPECIES: ABC transporter permease [unclassified Streptomyces]MDX3506282.1 ABC transporter permease [Streptomyces sp. ATCC51928]MDX5525677.1 ABC transporter permease [Streptomyces sp. DE06-01C]